MEANKELAVKSVEEDVDIYEVRYEGLRVQIPKNLKTILME